MHLSLSTLHDYFIRSDDCFILAFPLSCYFSLVSKYINLVRSRALSPDATGKDIRIEYERTVELLFEDQRFLDLRR